MGIQIKGSNDTISAADGSIVLEGATLTFTNENISGISTMASAEVTGNLSIADTIVHTGDTNTKIRFSDADTISFETGGSARAFINSAGDLTIGGSAGNLGKLYIKQAADTDSEGVSLLNSGGSNSFRIYLGDSSGAVGHIGHGGQKQLNITQAGLVGVGTATPDALLHLGAISGSAQLKMQRTNNAANTNDYGRIYWESYSGTLTGQISVARESAENDGYMHFKTASSGTLTERLRITSGGKVNIGGNYTQSTAPISVTTTANAFGYRLLTGSNVVVCDIMNNDSEGNCEIRGYYNNNSGTRGEGYRLESNGETFFNPGGNTGLSIKTTGEVTVGSNIQLGNAGIVTAKSFVPTQYQLGNRNILYNGAMQVNQYATQVTGLSNYNSYPTCDRWRCIISNGGTYTVENTTEGPADTGFNKALRFTCTTADNAGQPNLANADGYVAIEQRLEGFDVQGIQKGTTSAKTLTLSFWCKSNLTGTYNIELFDQDNQRRVGFQYTVSSSGSWEKKTFNFPAETNSSYPLGNDNGDSLRLRWFLAAGNNWRTGTNSGSWAANTTNQRAQSNVSLSTATSNYFALTGVQLEVGDHATPFEWIKFGDELKRCQRYYQKIGTGNFGDYSLGTGYVYNNGNNLALGVYLACPLRASPTVAVTGNMNVRYPAGGSTQVDVNSPNVPSNHDPYCHWLAIGWGITSDIGSNGDLASLNNSNNDGVTISAEL